MEVRVSLVSYLSEKKSRGLIYNGCKFVGNLISNGEQTPEAYDLLLNKVTMQLKPGSITVLMGLGHNYRALLECIAMRQKGGIIGGKIMYDGAIRKRGIYKDIALINDIGISHFDSLSVFDYLYFGARLRVTHGVIECRERARQAARLVGLEGSVKIGRLSKSQIRILSIAAELVSNPTLLCLIDPTEGLDAGGALEVMRVLHTVSKRVSMATTIVYNVFSIHEDMLRLVDNVALMVGSRLETFTSVKSFHGRAMTTASNLITQASVVVIDHERNHSFVKRKEDLVPISASHANTLRKVTEDLAKLTASGASGATLSTGNADSVASPVISRTLAGERSPQESSSPNPLHLLGQQRDAQGYAAFPDDRIGSSPSPRNKPRSSQADEFFSTSRRTGEPGLPIRYHKSLAQEFTILFLRSLAFHWKNSIYLRMGLFRFVLAGAIIGTLVWNNGSHLDSSDLLAYSEGLVDSDAYNVTSAMFVVVAMSLIGTAFAVPYLHSNVHLLKFEVSSGLQTTLASWLSLVLIDIPMYTVAAMIIGAIVYNMIDIQGSATSFFGTIFMVTLTGYSLAAVCAMWFRSKTMATFMFSLFASFCLVFSGYLQYIPALPGIWVWASKIVFTRWAFESFLIVAFDQAPDGDSYLGAFDFDNTSSVYCNGWLLMWFIGLQLLVLAGLSPPLSSLQLFSAESSDAATAKSLSDSQSALVDKYLAAMSTASQSLESGDSRSSFRTEFGNILRIQLPGAFQASADSAPSADHQTASQILFSPEEIFPRVIAVPKNMTTTLTFSRLKYTKESLSGAQDSNVESKFQGVSGQVSPGSCCCIVDGTNDGSSALLLQVLGGKCRSTGKTTGVICANDQRLGRNMYYLNAAYVQRGDVTNVSTLTVREVLRFAALLRRTDQHSCASVSRVWRQRMHKSDMIEAVGRAELIGMTGDVDQRVNDVLALMGLESVADFVVGEVHKIQVGEARDSRLKAVLSKVPWINNRSTRTLNGRPMAISPAQLRCLTIGTELVNRPGLIFLEDPVADLEWHEAEQVTQVIRSLAQGGRTILCNIEQPTMRLMSMFNEVMMLGSGLLLYAGPMDASASYFDNIGFERLPGQNDLEYLQDIASDKGRMRLVGGKKGNALSPEDLADLNRSLANIKASKGVDGAAIYAEEDASSPGVNSPKSRHTKVVSPKPVKPPTGDRQDSSLFSIDDRGSSAIGSISSGNVYHDPLSSGSSGASPKGGENRRGTLTKIVTGSCAVSAYKHTAPIGPTSWVLTWRGFKLLLADKKLIVIHCLQCLVAGTLLGSVWWQLTGGNYQERMSLFAVSYVCVNLFIVDSLEGVYHRKEAFMRESFVEASGFVSYYLSDTAPSLLLYSVGAVLFIAPLYAMSGLRDGASHFVYFYLITLASVFCNYSLAYLLSMLTPSMAVCRMLFSGAVIPLQLLMSGYLVLISSMPEWISWGSYICPMSYFLAGCFRNEFENNASALNEGVTFSSLEDMYDYHTSLEGSVIAVVLFAVIYKLIWLALLKMFTVLKRRAVMRRVQSARKKARAIVTAGLRWRDGSAADGNYGDEAMGDLDFGSPSMA